MIQAIKEYIGNYRLVILSLIVVGVIMVGLLSRAPDRQATLIKQGVKITAKDPTRFVDGYDWNKIEELDLAFIERRRIKTYLLKTTLESTIINNKIILTPKGHLAEYAQLVDKFYQDSKNIEVPLFFAFKIADMMKTKTPAMLIQVYKQKMMERLQRAGVIKA